MSWEPIPDPDPRFRVATIEGYPITASGRPSGSAQLVLYATVIDSFYGSEHGRFASDDAWSADEVWLANPGERGYSVRRGREGTLTAAADRCAELNAWHEREGWGEDVPLAS